MKHTRKEQPATLTSNQYVLLAVLGVAARTGPTLVGTLSAPPEPVFPSQRAWLGAATELYLTLWPGGSHPEWGPEKAIRSVLRKRWVTETWCGQSLLPALTSAGVKVLRAADPSNIRPQYVLDVLADIRQRGAAAVLADIRAETELLQPKES